MVILDLEDAVPAEQKVSACADAVAWLSGDEVALVPQVETAAGLTRASELGSVPGVTRLAFGHLDFAVDVDASPTGETMTWARSALVVASRAAGSTGAARVGGQMVDAPVVARAERIKSRARSNR
jgi:citrate lyase subunit beta/citryl-CoA lyase